jgi:hypothetical protein
MASNSNRDRDREVAVADKHRREERVRGREVEWGLGFGVLWSRFLSLSEGRGDLGFGYSLPCLHERERPTVRSVREER